MVVADPVAANGVASSEVSVTPWFALALKVL